MTKRTPKIAEKTRCELELEDKLADCERALALLMQYGERKEAHKYWQQHYGAPKQ